MSKLFSLESKVVQFLAMIGNLVMVNLLWLITSLPIITIGASTTAMYSVVFKYADNSDDEVLKPFFRAFVSNFKQSTLLWIPICLVLVILGIDGYYLISHANSGATPLLWIPFFVVLLVIAVLMAYAFPQIARFEINIRTVLHNSLLLSLLHFFQSIGMIVLNILPWAMMLVLPEVFAMTGIFWLMFGASAIAYFNAKVLLKIFKKHEPEQEDEVAEEEI